MNVGQEVPNVTVLEQVDGFYSEENGAQHLRRNRREPIGKLMPGSDGGVVVVQ